MKNRILTAGMALAMAALLLGGCSPRAEDAPTPVPTAQPTAAPTGDPHDKNVPPKPSPTAKPTVKPSEGPEIWEGEKMIWALPDAPGPNQATAPHSLDGSIVDMIPIIETVLEARCKYETWFKDDLKRYYGTWIDFDPNEHLIKKDAYVWTVLAEVIGAYGYMHPDAVCGEDGTVTLPESAVRDFMALCFADYTPEYKLSESSLQKWAKKQASIGEEAGVAALTYADGSYVCTPGKAAQPLQSQFIIVGGYTVDRDFSFGVYQMDWPASRDITTYTVQLRRLGRRSELGLLWRIETVVRIGCTDESRMTQAWQDQ